jgi:hypothetical protein
MTAASPNYPLADTRWWFAVLQYGPGAGAQAAARTAVVEALQQIVNVTG